MSMINADELVMCVTCGFELSDDEVEALGDECKACHAKRHFECAGCTDLFELVDESKAHPGHCESCAESIDLERLDGLKDELQRIVDRIIDRGGERRLVRAIAAIRRVM
jgi:predicted Zn-ribbon and HTH transcriptional regulator